MNTKGIRVETDGTALGSKAFYPDGTEIGGIKSFNFPPITRDDDRRVILECELLGGFIDIPGSRKCVSVHTDGTTDGTKILAPNGDELSAKTLKLEIAARKIPQATIEFFIEPRPTAGSVSDTAFAGPDLRAWRDEALEAIKRSGIKDATSIIAVVEHLKRESNVPHLGCATTYELLAELLARAEVGGYAKYRTVDSD